VLTTKRPQDAAARRLLELYGQLADVDRASLLAFAEFLATRDAAGAAAPSDSRPPPPKEIPRPPQESVVAAMRRLSASYHMLDRGVVLHEASALMGAHVMQGRPAAAVIDDLEAVFQRAYDRLLEQSED
jgi:hypothetical protein